MVSSCCAKFNFLLKAVLNSQRWHWRTGRLRLQWRWGTSRSSWLAGSRQDDTGPLHGKCSRERGVPHWRSTSFSWGKQYWETHSRAEVTWIWLGFAPTAIAIVPPVQELSGLSWCFKTQNLPCHSRKAAGQPCSPLPSLPPNTAPFSSDCRQVHVCGTGQLQQSRCTFPWLLRQWRDVGCTAPAQITTNPAPGSTQCMIQLQVSVELGRCALFRKRSWQGLDKMFRLKPPVMQSH